MYRISSLLSLNTETTDKFKNYVETYFDSFLILAGLIVFCIAITSTFSSMWVTPVFNTETQIMPISGIEQWLLLLNIPGYYSNIFFQITSIAIILQLILIIIALFSRARTAFVLLTGPTILVVLLSS